MEEKDNTRLFAIGFAGILIIGVILLIAKLLLN
jgi:hypothetical protein